MRWRNTETPTVAGSAGSLGAPAVVELMELVDRNGNVLLSLTKDVAAAFALAIAGSMSATGTSTPTAIVLPSATTTLANGQQIISLTTAITANSTLTDSPAGSIGVTSHATGVGKLFMSDATKWQFAVVA